LRREDKAYKCGYHRGILDAVAAGAAVPLPKPVRDQPSQTETLLKTSRGSQTPPKFQPTREQWSQTPVKNFTTIGIQNGGPGESSDSTMVGARPKANARRSLPY
jgi:hypothetical protein